MNMTTIDKIIESLGELSGDVKIQIRNQLQKALAEQGLVTAETFETQRQVLLRTREKLALLEQRLNELEAVLK